MKPALLLYLFLSYSCILRAQDTGEFAAIDARMLDIPKDAAVSASSIGTFIQSNFKDVKEKYRAIYRWVTYNIKYDADSMYAFNWGADPTSKVTVALRRRKGVCENYTALFNDIALKCGLESYIISGYTKQSGRIDKTGHTWCAGKINNEWFLFDPTWDEGYRDANYFMVDPGQFIESHMPFDPMWQLLVHPVSHSDFYNSSIHSTAGHTYNFNDTIKSFMQLNELQQLEATATRINNSGIANDLIKNYLAYVRMEINIIYEDEDMNQYNLAVNDINNATNIFNDFIQYRNNGFPPSKPAVEIMALLDTVNDKLLSKKNWIFLTDHQQMPNTILNR